jgi:hypothetical protein
MHYELNFEAEPFVGHDEFLESLLHRLRSSGRPRLSFLITARHGFTEIGRAVDVLATATAWRARRLGGWR